MNALEIRGLTKCYPDFTLDALNLTLPGGCIMGLIGKNGAGKSTTVKLILNMIRKDGGSVTVFGRDTAHDVHLIKEDIGVVLDEAGIPECLTAKQVGKIMRHTFTRWNDDTYAALLRTLSLPTDKPFKDFSRGMKMKLGIAVALSHEAKLLILDEPTSGLDPVVRDEVVAMFSDFVRDDQHAVLISSHIVSDLEKLCDYVAFLHNGKLLLCEEKDRLLAAYGMLHGTEQALQELPAESIVHKQVNPYGAQAIVLREHLPADLPVSPVTMEELFVFMIKEANRA